MTSLPEEDEWFCPECKNENDIVCAGGKAMKGCAIILICKNSNSKRFRNRAKRVLIQGG